VSIEKQVENNFNCWWKANQQENSLCFSYLLFTYAFLDSITSTDQPIYRPDWYIGLIFVFTNISVSVKMANFIGLS